MLLLALSVAYLLGCCSAGLWLVRARAGRDLRALGSGRTGARNAGRILGRGGFAAVLLLDMAKGALAVALAQRLAPGPWTGFLASGALVAGHCWPAPWGFRGGRGIAPALGAALLLEPRLIGLMLVPFLLGWLLGRRFEVGGVAALALALPFGWLLGLRAAGLLWIAGLIALLLLGHRGGGLLATRPKLEVKP